MMQNNERLISALEVAYRASLHPATIYRKALRGEIPGLVKLGKTVRFKESEIEKWLNEVSPCLRRNSPPRKS
jgi:excisionase family DNA binding protein